jgi:hypothetical protein
MSNTAKLDPSRAALRSDSELPKCKTSTILKFELKRATPQTARLEDRRTKDRKLSVLPKWRKSRTAIAFPIWAKLRNAMELPRCK